MRKSGEGRIAVVTGGTGALGSQVSRALLAQGYRVWVPWIAEEEAEGMRDLVEEAKGSLVLRRVNVTAPEEVDAFFAEIEARSGGLDALCNVAGGFRADALEETGLEGWERMLRMNASSVFLCSRAALPLMRSRGGGSIVNVTALPALERGAAGMSAYAASKAAVLSLTHSLSRELLHERVRVNAVAPEVLDTPANRAAMPAADWSKWVEPEDAARVIAFLASDDARCVTGSVLVLRR